MCIRDSLYPVYANDVSEFRRRVAARVAVANVSCGLRRDAEGTLEDLSLIHI